MKVVSPPPIALSEGRQGHYAGAMSRLVAFGIDIAVIWLLYSLFAVGLSLASQLVAGTPFTLAHHQIAGLIVLVGWGFIYFAYQWALNGKTVGMALFGLQVVAASGSPVTGRRAALRTVALPLSFLLLGVGLLGILVQRERRALHDLLAGTAVIYSWDARAARLRWLARKDPVVPAPVPPPSAEGSPAAQ